MQYGNPGENYFIIKFKTFVFYFSKLFIIREIGHFAFLIIIMMTLDLFMREISRPPGFTPHTEKKQAPKEEFVMMQPVNLCQMSYPKQPTSKILYSVNNIIRYTISNVLIIASEFVFCLILDNLAPLYKLRCRGWRLGHGHLPS